MHDKEVFWVVDYDIPSNPTIRSRFYRSIRRHAEARGISNIWSTRSVIITNDYQFSVFVYYKALELGGKAHIYKAVRII